MKQVCECGLVNCRYPKCRCGKIITEFVYPPIPIRRWDWLAHYDGDEETGPFGEAAGRGLQAASVSNMITSTRKEPSSSIQSVLMLYREA